MISIGSEHRRKQSRQKQRSAIAGSIASTSAWWKMHDAGADGAVLDEFMGDVAGLSALAITGTVTGVWTDRPGWFTPDVLENTAISAADVADSLCALNNLKGGLLVVFQLNLDNNPGSGTEVICHYGTNGAGGLWQIGLNYGANANLNIAWQPVSGTFASRSSNITAFVGADITCAVYFDVANSNIEIFSNTASSVSLAMATDGDLPGTTITNPQLGLFCRPLTSDNKLGNTGSAPEVRDLFMIRFENDQSGQIASIVQGFIDTPTELPWELEGM